MKIDLIIIDFFLINKTGVNIIFNISNKSTIKGIAIKYICIVILIYYTQI